MSALALTGFKSVARKFLCVIMTLYLIGCMQGIDRQLAQDIVWRHTLISFLSPYLLAHPYKVDIQSVRRVNKGVVHNLKQL